MIFEFTKTRFLLCEGDDDKGFLETLLQARGLPEFQVCHAAECNQKGVGGRSGFNHSLSGLMPIKGFRSVKAILIVTDNDRASSFSEVQTALTINGHTAPATIQDNGSVHRKPVAILMIPSDKEHGDLEKLSLPEVERKWPDAKRCVTEFLNCTGATAWTRPSSLNKARTRAATVGFNEDDPYRGLGHLFRNGTLSTANTCFDAIADFLRNFDARMGI